MDNQVFVSDLCESKVVFFEKLGNRPLNGHLVIFRVGVADNLPTQNLRHPALHNAARQQNKLAVIQVEVRSPEANREPEARVLPNPGLVTVTFCNECRESRISHLAREFSNIPHCPAGKLNQVISRVAGLIEQSAIKFNEFAVLKGVVIAFLMSTIPGPITGSRNQAGQYRTATESRSKNDDVVFHRTRMPSRSAVEPSLSLGLSSLSVYLFRTSKLVKRRRAPPVVSPARNRRSPRTVAPARSNFSRGRQRRGPFCRVCVAVPAR